MLPSRGVTAQTWTDTCSAKGFEILVIARVGRRRSSCQMHWATSSPFWMFLILIRVHSLFNCSVDVLSANLWMILHFTELNVNPHLTDRHVTKQYVYSFSTKALIFIMKMWVPTPTWQVLAFWKFLVHKMYSRTGGNENRVYIFLSHGKMNEWIMWKKWYSKMRGTGWYGSAANSKFLISLRLFGCLIFKLFEFC